MLCFMITCRTATLEHENHTKCCKEVLLTYFNANYVFCEDKFCEDKFCFCETVQIIKWMDWILRCFFKKKKKELKRRHKFLLLCWTADFLNTWWTLKIYADNNFVFHQKFEKWDLLVWWGVRPTGEKWVGCIKHVNQCISVHWLWLDIISTIYITETTLKQSIVSIHSSLRKAKHHLLKEIICLKEDMDNILVGDRFRVLIRQIYYVAWFKMGTKCYP